MDTPREGSELDTPQVGSDFQANGALIHGVLTLLRNGPRREENVSNLILAVPPALLVLSQE